MRRLSFAACHVEVLNGIAFFVRTERTGIGCRMRKLPFPNFYSRVPLKIVGDENRGNGCLFMLCRSRKLVWFWQWAFVQFVHLLYQIMALSVMWQAVSNDKSWHYVLRNPIHSWVIDVFYDLFTPRFVDGLFADLFKPIPFLTLLLRNYVLISFLLGLLDSRARAGWRSVLCNQNLRWRRYCFVQKGGFSIYAIGKPLPEMNFFEDPNTAPLFTIDHYHPVSSRPHFIPCFGCEHMPFFSGTHTKTVCIFRDSSVVCFCCGSLLCHQAEVGNYALE